MKDSKNFKIIMTALLSALASLTFIIENLFPPIIVPGAKMGLSNIFVLFAVLYLGAENGFCVLAVKILIGSIFGSTVSAIMYSLPAGIISLLVQVLLVKYGDVSIVCISVLGAFINSCIQNLVFCAVTKTFEYLAYMPYLSVISVIAGLIVGLAVCLLIKKLLPFIDKRSNYDKKED